MFIVILSLSFFFLLLFSSLLVCISAHNIFFKKEIQIVHKLYSVILHILKIQSWGYFRIDPRLTDELQPYPIRMTFIIVGVDKDFVLCMHAKWLYTSFFRFMK